MADKKQDLNVDKTTPLIDFPCDFPIKVMGETQDGFAQTIVELIQALEPTFNASKIEMRASSGGKYISLTCTVHVSSQSQLDDIYRSISAHPLVKYSL
jgi:putative lipoic acid-binding regulatory protein